MPTIFDIAAAITSDLAALAAPLSAGLNASYTVRATPIPGAELEKLTAVPVVSVVPKSVTPTYLTRTDRLDEITISIGLQAKITGDEQAGCRTYYGLLSEILKALWGKPQAGAKFTGGEVVHVYLPEHLRLARAYSGVLELTYKAAP